MVSKNEYLGSFVGGAFGDLAKVLSQTTFYNRDDFFGLKLSVFGGKGTFKIWPNFLRP